MKWNRRTIAAVSIMLPIGAAGTLILRSSLETTPSSAGPVHIALTPGRSASLRWSDSHGREIVVTLPSGASLRVRARSVISMPGPSGNNLTYVYGVAKSWDAMTREFEQFYSDNRQFLASVEGGPIEDIVKYIAARVDPASRYPSSAIFRSPNRDYTRDTWTVTATRLSDDEWSMLVCMEWYPVREVNGK